ncbi:MAG: peptidoglycan editing factor PgeF [Clostridium sp.]|jgi:hypothetical protein|nr:peptidoglycan editing factor PgeF [Clostridium sp.]
MKKIKRSQLKIVKDFMVFDNENTKVVFTTALEDKSYNRNTEEGVKNLQDLKKQFGVSNVVYVKQIHSDIVISYNGEDEKQIIQNEGDAIITNVKDAIIGVFTADCTPVIIVDDKKKVIAAIHSGWKGTFKSITKKTIKKLISEYDVKVEDLKVYIGPHIRQCCYEISEELKEKFLIEKGIEEQRLFKGRNLSMEECILEDLRECNIKEENINSIDLCTHCEKEIPLFSYRGSNGDYGRLFSFTFIK